MRDIGHVACMGEMRNAYKILVGKLVRKNHSDDLGVGGSVILQLILGK
jgi:hypothetical protein